MHAFPSVSNLHAPGRWSDELKVVGTPARAWQRALGWVFLSLFILSLVFSSTQAFGQGGR
jgi:hypothetical protein